MEKKKFVNLEHLIRTVINFCNYDFASLSLCIEVVQEFSSQIINPVCDHMFNGEKEDPLFLQKIYALFLDCDEIIDNSSFRDWLEHFDYTQYTAIRLANYWYSRSSSYRATTWEDTPLLLRKTKENLQALMHPQERAGTYFVACPDKKRMCLSLNKKPMVHHFSWVRTKEQMLKKVSNWGHRKDRNWKHLVEQEFSSSFLRNRLCAWLLV